MLEWIRKFDLKKTGFVNVSVCFVNIIVHVLVILKILPYQWVNGGRTESYEMACQISVASIVVMIVCIFITLIACKIIPLKLNRFWEIALSVLLIAMLPFSLLGVIQQFLGTLFEKCVMSIVALVAFCTATRIAFEKRW